MPAQNATTSHAAGRLLQVLGRRYMLVLAAVAALAVLDQAVLQPLLVRLNTSAPVINVAGRQRMLSQRLSKAALAMQTADSAADFEARRSELRQTLQQWSSAHHGLVAGDPERGIARTTSPTIVQALSEIEPHFDALRNAAAQLSQSSAANPTATSARRSPAIATILQHESAYLPQMDRIVQQFEQESQARVAQLRWAGFSIMLGMLLLVGGVGLFVVRPAMRTIDLQVQELQAHAEELERRVDERTRELTAANASLLRESREREVAQDKTRQLSAQLAHASRVTAMGQLATGLAHEINQPLAAITNYTEAAMVNLQKPPESVPLASIIRSLELAKQAALRAGGIVRRMRNFVRPQPSQRSQLDLALLIDEVAELCRFEALRAGVTMKIDTASDLPRVAADPIEIQQVLVNLVQNAVQSMQHSTERRLHIRCYAAADEVIVDVGDSGPGFRTAADEALAPFYTTKPDGLGLGLAICQSIIAAHGGTLRVASQLDRGATVSFHLPSSSVARDPDDQLVADRACCG